MFTKFIFLFFSFSFFGFSQVHTIEGVVKDEGDIAIAFANIVLEDTEDASIIAGTTTNDDGAFKLENLKPSVYNIRISYLGYGSFSAKIKLSGNVNLKTIILNDNIERLDGVVVTAKRPTVKRLVDRLVFNVENSTLSNSMF